MIKKTIVILGGAGTGKTTLAKNLSLLLGYTVLSVDEYRKQLQNNKKSDPFFRVLLPVSIYRNNNQRQLLTLHSHLSNKVFESFYKNVLEKQPLENMIIEGDDLPPQKVLSIFNGDENAAIICLYDTSKKDVGQTIRTRDHIPDDFTSSVLSAQIEHAYLNGQRMYKEAKQIGIPCLSSRPFNTLLDRVVARIK